MVLYYVKMKVFGSKMAPRQGLISLKNRNI